jgi:hypothetical protein
VGTPKPIAGHLQDLLESRACDSFVVSPAIYRGMIEPVLPHGGAGIAATRHFPQGDRGRTLRENIQSARCPKP